MSRIVIGGARYVSLAGTNGHSLPILPNSIKKVRFDSHQFSTSAIRNCTSRTANNPPDNANVTNESFVPDQSTPKTALVMMNMGGPETLDDVNPFLNKLFQDRDLIQLPMQKYLGRFIADRRTNKVKKMYSKIGGGSPIKKWTQKQGQLICDSLNSDLPDDYSLFSPYIAFRYHNPSTEQTLKELHKERVDRIIVFSQYQQFSCSTSGSSYRELVGILRDICQSDPTWRPNVTTVDRWPTHPDYIASVAESIEEAIESKINKNGLIGNDRILVLFSGHAIPLLNVIKGDSYSIQVSSTVENVMKHLKFKYPYRLAYQSQVGPVRWFGAVTSDTINKIGQRKDLYDAILIVPITFTSDHIETLYELDIELIESTRKKYPHLVIERAESLNDRPSFIKALSNIVREHILEHRNCSAQFQTRCHECQNESCANYRSYFTKKTS